MTSRKPIVPDTYAILLQWTRNGITKIDFWRETTGVFVTSNYDEAVKIKTNEIPTKTYYYKYDSITIVKVTPV